MRGTVVVWRTVGRSWHVGSHGHGVARRDVSECVLHGDTDCNITVLMVSMYDESAIKGEDLTFGVTGWLKRTKD